MNRKRLLLKFNHDKSKLSKELKQQNPKVMAEERKPMITQ